MVTDQAVNITDVFKALENIIIAGYFEEKDNIRKRQRMLKRLTRYGEPMTAGDKHFFKYCEEVKQTE